MAFDKTIISSTHAPAQYHRIPSLTIDWGNRILRGVIASFFTKEARDANAGALGSTEFTIHGKNFPFKDASEKGMRALIGVGDTQELLNVQFFFDGDMAHGKAAIEMQVAGKPFNTELQFQVEKEKLPVDFLKATYAIMAKDEPFKDAETV